MTSDAAKIAQLEEWMKAARKGEPRIDRRLDK